MENKDNKPIRLKKDGTPMKPRGGKREGSGRAKKSDEMLLIEKLSKFDDQAFLTLEKGIVMGNYKFWAKWMEYRFGSPTKKLDITSGGDKFNMPVIEFFKTKEDKE